MKKTIKNLNNILAASINAIAFFIVLGLFILIFFYPDVAGEIAGKMARGFNDVFLLKK